MVSLFEAHTDIIRKGGRATHYGHKINLTTGRSSLVLDVVVETGDPADSERCLPMLQREERTPKRSGRDPGQGGQGGQRVVVRPVAPPVRTPRSIASARFATLQWWWDEVTRT